MRDGKTLTQKVAKNLKDSSKNTPAVAGRKTDSKRLPEPDVVINGINQLFAEMELNYPLQYAKAFKTPDREALAKKVWFDHLKSYQPDQFLKASYMDREASSYMPTVHDILKYLSNDFISFGLLEPHAAYVEACRARSPKVNHAWSHPAVYYAGRESDWFFLANSTERTAFPVFERNYRSICERVFQGDELPSPLAKALPEKPGQALSSEENKERMRKLRGEIGI